MRLPRPLRDILAISQLLKGAETEAERDGSELPGPEHLMLSAFALADGTAVRSVEGVALSADDVREAIVRAHTEALRSVGVPASSPADLPPAAEPTGPYRLTAPGQQVFQTAVRLAKQDRPASLIGAHIVAAGCELEKGTLARALSLLGVDRGDLAAAAREAARRR